MNKAYHSLSLAGTLTGCFGERDALQFRKQLELTSVHRGQVYHTQDENVQLTLLPSSSKQDTLEEEVNSASLISALFSGEGDTSNISQFDLSPPRLLHCFFFPCNYYFALAHSRKIGNKMEFQKLLSSCLRKCFGCIWGAEILPGCLLCLDYGVTCCFECASILVSAGSIVQWEGNRFGLIRPWFISLFLVPPQPQTPPVLLSFTQYYNGENSSWYSKHSKVYSFSSSLPFL